MPTLTDLNPTLEPYHLTTPAGIADFLAPAASKACRDSVDEIRNAVIASSGRAQWLYLRPAFSTLTSPDVLGVLIRLAVELVLRMFFPPPVVAIVDWLLSGLKLWPGFQDDYRMQAYAGAVSQLVHTPASSLSPAVLSAAPPRPE